MHPSEREKESPIANLARLAEVPPSRRWSMSFPAEGRRQGLVPALLVVALLILAVALRFYRLGAWSFEATEIFTLRDSISLRPSNPRPLLYFLNYHVVRPFLPLDEFGLRLLPAIFGMMAIPAFYLIGRRLVGTRAALFGTLLLTVSALHVFYSQFARYWSLVFLLSAVYPFALYLGLRERSWRWLAFGLVTGFLAVLAHPVSVLLLGGLGLWMVATYMRRDQLAQFWSQRNIRWAVLLLVLVGALITVRFIPVLQDWVSEHDKKPGNGQFLLHAPGGQRWKQIFYLLAYVESLTLPVVLAAAVGLYVLWQERDRTLALLLICLAVFPMIFLTLLSIRTPVSTYYLLPTVPVFYLGSGIFLDRLFEVDWKLRPRWLLPVTLTAVILAPGAPTLISQYRDGRRYDFRNMAHWLERRLTSEDVVYSDQHMVLAHYLPGIEVLRLRDTAPLVESVRGLRQAGRGGVLWIVLPAPSHAFRTNPELRGLHQWMYENCQLRNTLGVGRIDFRQQYLQIYRCPAAMPAGGATHSR
jgi:hypothetical protein